ncbi:MAG: efflux RND transporter periplasmic adaptor subunit [Prolixibacteraceae bacterium]|jgi:RND family efflux transporter MFP subunit|nr:efflux RND transporter periplasmic adaptor subunit [Prolixibacteraceae bacterium]
MTRTKKIFILVLGAFAAASCGNRDASVSTDLAVPVSVEDIKPASIEKTINTTGTLTASKEVTINSEVAGDYHLKINPRTGRKFALGDLVEKDQVIVEFTDEEYVNGIAIESKKLNLEIAEQEFKKQESLYNKGGVTQREYRNSEVSFIDAKYSYERAQLQLEKMKIRTPFKGVITDLPFYTEGTRLASGNAMFSMMDYSKMQMEVNLPEKYIGEVENNQLVRIMNYTLPNDTLSGRVSQLSPAISTETRTFKGILTVENPELKLRPGMFAKADIIIARKDSVVVIPKDIIISGQRGKTVFIVDNGTAQEKRVTFGYETQDRVEITSGLKYNDRIVIKGFETLRDRSKVKIIK